VPGLDAIKVAKTGLADDHWGCILTCSTTATEWPLTKEQSHHKRRARTIFLHFFHRIEALLILGDENQSAVWIGNV
jgi:hypothetical protein